MKKKIFIVVCSIFIFAIFAERKQSITQKTIDNHWKDISHWTYGCSSILRENNTIYSWENIKDMNVSTAWVEGAEGDGIKEWIIVPVHGLYQYLSYEHGILNKKLNITLKINNGFCKSEATFKNNNRVKKAEITIYEVPLAAYEDSRGTQALDEPSVMYETEIELKDSMEEQDFSFEASPKGTFKHGSFYLYCQLTILEVYPGEKYHDTCISEMHATAEVIKENPADSPTKKRNKNRWQK